MNQRKRLVLLNLSLREAITQSLEEVVGGVFDGGGSTSMVWGL